MIGIIYFSKKGSTEKMAQAVVEAVADKEHMLIPAADIELVNLSEIDAFALGCPADQKEGLEVNFFVPALEKIEKELTANKDKKFVMFGSYGWGGGKYMENWLERCSAIGLAPVAAPVVCKGAPDDDTLEKCRELGRALL